MAHLIAVLVFVFVTNYPTTDATALDCSYGMFDFPLVGSKYTCTAEPIIDQDDTVNAVYGTHETQKGHLDVEGINIAGQNLPFFPRNMEGFFPNLSVIDFSYNSITSITNSHLTPFLNLRHLNLQYNNISKLENNVFSGMWTPSTSYYIDFDGNAIEHVGHDINIPNSGTTDFRHNKCINERATTPDEISILKQNLLRNCTVTISQTEETLESRTDLLTQLENMNTELETRNTELEDRNTELEKVNTELETRSSQLENSSNTWKQLETIGAFLQALIENKINFKVETATSEN